MLNPRNALIVGGALALLMALSVAGCGGGDPDADALKGLREKSEFTFDKSDDEVVQTIEAALAIAGRNSGKPLGEEAATFGEELFLQHSWNDYYGDSYIDKVPEASGVEDTEQFQDVRRMVGFVESFPAPYTPTEVLGRLHTVFDDHVDHYLFRLDEALAARQLWASELQSAGSTSHSFNTEVSGAWEQYGLEFAYLRSLAERVREPSEFLAGCDLVATAIAVADFEPPATSHTYENGVFVTRYTPDGLHSGIANAESLAAAITAARTVFPDEG